MNITKDIWEVLAQKLDTKSLLNCLLLNRETYKILSSNESIWRRKLTEFDDSCIFYRDTYNKKRSLKDLYFQLKAYEKEYTEDKTLELLCSKNSKENLDLIYYLAEKKGTVPNRGIYGAAKDGNTVLMEYFLKRGADPFYGIIARCEVGDISNISHNFNDYRRSERDKLYFALGASGNVKNITSVVQRTEIDIDWDQIVEGLTSTGNYDMVKPILDHELVGKSSVFRGMGRNIKNIDLEISNVYIMDILYGAIDGGNTLLVEKIFDDLGDRMNRSKVTMQNMLRRAQISGYKRIIQILEREVNICDNTYYKKYAKNYNYKLYNPQMILNNL
jgi:hypothetical protein